MKLSRSTTISLMLIQLLWAPLSHATVIDDVKNIVTTINSRVNTINNRVVSLQSNTNELMGQVRNGVDALGSDALIVIDEVITDIQQNIASELEGRDEFLANDAVAFRQELISLIDEMEALMNLLGDVTVAYNPVTLNLESIKDAIGLLPDRSLYPLYRIFQTLNANISDGQNGPSQIPFRAYLQGAISTLEVMAPVFKTEYNERNQLILTNTSELSLSANILGSTASVLQLLGKILDAAGKAFEWSKDVGIHGYVHGTVTNNWLGYLGKGLEGIGSGCTKASEYILKKISELNNLRFQIEPQLIDSKNQLALLYLPSANGGLLETVRDVVAANIEESEAAGVYSGDGAGNMLNAGNAALEGKDYRTAYLRYREAYQELSSWPVEAAISSNAESNSGSVYLAWNAQEGRDYAVQGSDDLSEWRNLYEIKNSPEGLAEIERIPVSEKEFFRVYVRP